MVSKAFTALGHLQDYADASAKAHDELKSCMWQLTKSRRNVRSGIIGVDSTTAYTAELLREELRAQLRVVDGTSDGNDAGDLVDEDAVKDESSRTTTKSPPKWKVRNILSEIEKSKEAKESTIPSKSPETDTGVRQRKKTDKNEATSPSSSWTMIREADLDDEDEEKRILHTDPIKLFGGYFTARELKVAQSNARKALDGYIEAANEAAKLLALLHEKK